jgi:hypothetical protein
MDGFFALNLGSRWRVVFDTKNNFSYRILHFYWDSALDRVYLSRLGGLEDRVHIQGIGSFLDSVFRVDISRN